LAYDHFNIERFTVVDLVRAGNAQKMARTPKAFSVVARQLAANIFMFPLLVADRCVRQAAERRRLAACAPKSSVATKKQGRGLSASLLVNYLVITLSF
jgi:hypothetical protein